MIEGQASKTALIAAFHRAAHQVLEGGKIFADPLALRILGDGAEEKIHAMEDSRGRRVMRLFIAVRSRFAEEAVAASPGVRQVVVLGAGLDTFAYRATLAEGVRVLEVDHPATQAWKRDQLAAAGIAVPEWMTFVPVDFERESLGERLQAAGLQAGAETFFTWLGVVPYLTDEAVMETLRYIAGLTGGAQVVFDYANTPGPEDDAYAAAVGRLEQRVAEAGESIRSYFETSALHAALRGMGFEEIEDLGPTEIASRYFGISLNRDRGGHVLRAKTRIGPAIS